jgi:beta-phosphoglucomutase-like phosphatase (HAD superfamily)
MAEVLDAAGLADLFEVRVDGVEADRLRLPGKPDPAVFIEAARRLGTVAARAAVVEDSLAGAEAGRRGGFGLVIGVDRQGHPDALRQAGADIVVRDLEELRIGESGT